MPTGARLAAAELATSPRGAGRGRRPARGAGLRRGAVVRRAARNHGRRHRHQRQDLGRDLYPPDLGARWATPPSTSAPPGSRARGRRPSAHTTPDPITLQRVLAQAAAAGVTHAAMEASSHGLDQRRLDGVRLRAAGFTNFTQDHLDYHKTFDAYFAAKAAPVHPRAARRWRGRGQPERSARVRNWPPWPRCAAFAC